MNEYGGHWITTKRCPHCLKTKPLKDFHKDLATNSGLTVYCKECKNELMKEYRSKNPLKISVAQKKLVSRIKKEVLAHYGNGKLACVKCGFADVRALSLDHIMGGGTKLRRNGGTGGWTWYYKLRKQSYPKGYQTLCMNCQFIKREENNE